MRPVLSLLFTAVFWGCVWYPLRLLEQVGLSGSWQMLVSYGAAIVTLLLVRAPSLAGIAGHGYKIGVLALVAGWTNVGFVLEILVGAISAWLLAAEILTIREWLGGLLILAAGFIAVITENTGEQHG